MTGTAKPGALDTLLVVTGTLSGLSMSLLTPVLPEIEAEFADTPGIAYLGKLVVSVVGLAIVLFASLSAACVRRFGADRVLIGSFALYAVAAAAGSLAPSIHLLIATRFAQGIAVAIGVTTALALIGTFHQGAARDRRVGMHIGFSALLLSLLMPIGGWLGEISWRLTPLLGLVCLLHLTLALGTRRHLASALVGSPAQSAKLALGWRSMAAMAALALLIGILMYSPLTFLPFKAHLIGITNAGEIGLFATLQMVSATTASLLYGGFSTRVPARLIYLGAFGAGGIGMAMIALAGDGVLLATGLVVSGLGGGTMIPHLYADCGTRVAAADQVRITGLLKSASFLGLFVGPLTMQAVMDASSASGVFVALSVLMAAGLIGSQLRGPAPAVVPVRSA